MTAPSALGARALAEALGTGLLVAVIVGSGMQAQRLSPGDIGLQLLENSTASALALVALIFCLGPVSGAHLNPAVTLTERLTGKIDTPTTGAYICAQVAGGCAGTIAANLMFDLSPVDWSTTNRATGAVAFSEVLATFGLLTMIIGVARSGRHAAMPLAVAAYIGAAYWFTSSTGFANPAVTIARTLTDTFAGIAPGSVPAFVAAQLTGALLAVGVARVLFTGPDPSLEEVLDA